MHTVDLGHIYLLPLPYKSSSYTPNPLPTLCPIFMYIITHWVQFVFCISAGLWDNPSGSNLSNKGQTFKENLFSLPWQPSTINSILARDRVSWAPLPPNSGILIGFFLHGSCAGNRCCRFHEHSIFRKHYSIFPSQITGFHNLFPHLLMFSEHETRWVNIDILFMTK